MQHYRSMEVSKDIKGPIMDKLQNLKRALLVHQETHGGQLTPPNLQGTPSMHKPNKDFIRYPKNIDPKKVPPPHPRWAQYFAKPFKPQHPTYSSS